MKNHPDDDLLRQLGRLAAEDDLLSADDQELELVCAGLISADRLRALEARAAGDPEYARRLEAYRPLDIGSRSRISAALVRQADSARPAPSPARPAPSAAREAELAPVLPLVRPTQRRQLSRRPWGWAGAALAVAAAGVLFIGQRSGFDPRRPLPAYALDVTGGERELRGADVPAGPVVRLRPASRLDLVLRPATALPDAIAVEAFMTAGPDATVEPLPITFQIAAGGAARVSGTASELFGSRRGRWQLRLVVGRAGAARGDGLRLARGDDVSAPDARRVDVDLWLLDAL